MIKVELHLIQFNRFVLYLQMNAGSFIIYIITHRIFTDGTFCRVLLLIRTRDDASGVLGLASWVVWQAGRCGL